MFLPSFTLQTALKWFTLCALFCLVLVSAAQGDVWAVAATAAVASLLVIFLVHGLFFVVISVFARLMGRDQLPAQTKQGAIQLSPDEQILPPNQ